MQSHFSAQTSVSLGSSLQLAAFGSRATTRQTPTGRATTSALRGRLPKLLAARSKMSPAQARSLADNGYKTTTNWLIQSADKSQPSSGGGNAPFALDRFTFTSLRLSSPRLLGVRARARADCLRRGRNCRPPAESSGSVARSPRGRRSYRRPRDTALRCARTDRLIGLRRFRSAGRPTVRPLARRVRLSCGLAECGRANRAPDERKRVPPCGAPAPQGAPKRRRRVAQVDDEELHSGADRKRPARAESGDAFD